MSSVIIAGDTSGSVTLSAPSVAGTTTLTLPSTSGNVLTSANIGSNLPAGSVLQVVSTTKTDTFTTTTTGSYVDITGMSVSITPTSSSNKILVIFSGNQLGTSGTFGWALQLVRDTTAICVGTGVSNRIANSVSGPSPDNNWSMPSAINFLDSPSTTSSVTYKIQCRQGAGTFYFNRSPNDTDNSGYYRPASTITVMEIKG
jgi:hypothetical protein